MWEGDERSKLRPYEVECAYLFWSVPRGTFVERADAASARFGRDRWIRGSRLLVSHEEQPPERIWHGNGLAPVPGWSLLDLGHVALPDP